MKQTTIDTIRELLNNANGRPCSYPKMDAIEDAEKDFEDSIENDDIFIEGFEEDEDDEFDSTTYLRSSKINFNKGIDVCKTCQ